MNNTKIIHQLELLEQEHPQVNIKSKSKLKDYVEFCLKNKQKEKVKFKTSHHHILPKSYFEKYKNLSEFSWNGAHLLHKDHYQAHKLLYEALSDFKMMYSFYSMNNQDIRNGRLVEEDLILPEEYQRLMEEFSSKMSKQLKGRVVSEEWKRRISEGCVGRIMTNETKTKISLQNKGNTHSLETKRLMSERARMREYHPLSEEHKRKIGEGNKRRVFTDEMRKNISDSKKGENHPFYNKRHSTETIEKMTGQTRSKETKLNISKALKGYKQKRVICPHCNKEGGVSGMKQFHFEKCKFKQKENNEN